MKFDVKNIDKKVLLSLFKNMLKSRMIEEKMIILLRQGKVSKWFSGIGQEAISTGVTLLLWIMMNIYFLCIETYPFSHLEKFL